MKLWYDLGILSKNKEINSGSALFEPIPEVFLYNLSWGLLS
jgi:hypothetical protein